MTTVYAILLDFGALAFLGLLYYWFQRRRIIRSYSAQIQEGIQEINELLRAPGRGSNQAELEAFALELEQAAQTGDMQTMRAAIDKAPSNLPDEISEQLRQIEELF